MQQWKLVSKNLLNFCVNLQGCVERLVGPCRLPEKAAAPAPPHQWSSSAQRPLAASRAALSGPALIWAPLNDVMWNISLSSPGASLIDPWEPNWIVFFVVESVKNNGTKSKSTDKARKDVIGVVGGYTWARDLESLPRFIFCSTAHWYWFLSRRNDWVRNASVASWVEFWCQGELCCLILFSLYSNKTRIILIQFEVFLFQWPFNLIGITNHFKIKGIHFT